MLKIKNYIKLKILVFTLGCAALVVAGPLSAQTLTDAPEISDISVTNRKGDQARISWETDKPARGEINFGLTSNYGRTQVSLNGFEREHGLTLTNLSEDTEYHYRIKVKDASGNITFTKDRTFSTLDTPGADNTDPAKVNDLKADKQTQTSVRLTWKSPGDDGDDGAAMSYDIRYSTNPITATNWNTATQVTGEPTPRKANRFQEYTVVGLDPGENYFFAIKAEDEEGNISELSNVVEAQTLSTGGDIGQDTDTSAPASPFNFTARPTDEQITLTWTNPSDNDFARVIILRRDDAYPSSPTDGEAEVVYAGTGEEYTDINLQEKRYYYAIYAHDLKPNLSNRRVTAGTPEPDSDSVKIVLEAASEFPFGEVRGFSYQSETTVDEVAKNNGTQVFNRNTSVELTGEAKDAYEKLMQNRSTSQNNRHSIAYFLQFGTQTTQDMGPGERAGVINSFYRASGILPMSAEDWADIIRIAGEKPPVQTRAEAEEKAAQDFLKIYNREVTRSNFRENFAFNTIAYGLRPATRNIESEKKAIRIFETIYDRSPSSTADWDTMRAIAYSGVKR